MHQFKHVLVPTDFGESSRRALEIAMDLSNKYGASLTLLPVYEAPVFPYPGVGFPVTDLLTTVEQAARRAIDETLGAVRKLVPNAEGTLRLGVPSQEILKAIEETQAALVIMGTHGRRGISHALIGSVAERIVRLSPVPVLTVRGTPEKPT